MQVIIIKNKNKKKVKIKKTILIKKKLATL